MSDHRRDRDGRPDNAPADGTQINELTRTPDYKTGFQTPDPKDVHEEHYTTTPAEDRTGSADHGKYQPVEAQDPREVTGQFDRLATRDPAAMEHAPQAPEFAGAETVAGIGVQDTTLGSGITVAGGLGTESTSLAAGEAGVGLRPGVDQNPGYVPPSEKEPPHFRDRPGDLPAGAPAELQNEVAGEAENHDRL
ncbi:hypothetical protein [Deinococcus apachensis]|uniref:hypothetical protein n=1 Tax=Deinococcus apachensis TaxID=309886 RepID=UPI0003620EAF|nr:hypothetical protein [Deinococcus apachensis]